VEHERLGLRPIVQRVGPRHVSHPSCAVPKHAARGVSSMLP
jgi:hypothetical protein